MNLVFDLDDTLYDLSEPFRRAHIDLFKEQLGEECEALFDDLCTKTELASISQRLVVAKMLNEKKVYSDIVAQTGASTATISRVNRSLAFGAGGYDKIFSKESK